MGKTSLTGRGMVGENNPMDIRTQELEREIFDPTGHGIEVVDAHVARELLLRKEELEVELARVNGILENLKAEVIEEKARREEAEDHELVGRVVNQALAKECESLRSIFPQIAEAVGLDMIFGGGASLEFLRSLPRKISDKLKLRGEGAGMDKTSENREIDQLVLEALRGELEEFFEHPDCTIVEAVKLLKCRLKTIEAGVQTAEIRNKWSKRS